MRDMHSNIPYTHLEYIILFFIFLDIFLNIYFTRSMVFVFILISLKEQELKTTYRIFDIFYKDAVYIFFGA